jgi:pimeloyl-ACP methyl ester carboxylesterase
MKTSFSRPPSKPVDSTARNIAVGMGMITAGAWTAAHLTSSAVRNWRPGAGECRVAGRLKVRTFGRGRPVVVLLHGLAAAGDCFGVGFDQLGDHATVVVPDLLGFGGSTTNPGPLTAADHLDALDEALDALGLAGGPLVCGRPFDGRGAGVALGRPAHTQGPRRHHVVRRALP